MLKNKKAQALSKKIEAGAVIIILVVVLFLMYASLVPEAQSAGDSLNVSNRCEDVGCFYNTTDNAQTSENCRENSSNTSFSCPSSLGKGIPLGGLFGGGGIIFLVIMFVLLLTILKAVIPKDKK